MPQVFTYRQKLFPKALVLAAFVAIAATPDARELLASPLYWTACLAIELLLFAWNASLRITVDEQRLEVRGLPHRSLRWEQIEEGTMSAHVPTRRAGIIARAANKPMGPTTDELVLKLVITGEPALHVRLGDLKNGRAFADLVLSKVRFVRQMLQVPDPTTAPPNWVR